MNQKQKKIFYEGVDFSFELIKNYIKKYWASNCQTIEEKRRFSLDILEFLKSFEGNISLYFAIDQAAKEKNLFEDNKFFFEKGISDHTAYVIYCLQNAELMNVVENFKDYFENRIQSLLNENYPTFEDWLKTR